MDTDNKLTLEVVKEFVDKLKEQHKEMYEFFGCKLIENKMLSGTQVVIKSGDKIYYSPDIKSVEVKVLNIPDEDFTELKPPEFKISYHDNY